MDHIKKYEIPKSESNGIEKIQVFGKNGYIEYGDGTMSVGSVSPKLRTCALRCSNEVTYYIIEASAAKVYWGAEPENMSNVAEIQPDDVLIFGPDEWYCFSVDTIDGKLSFTEFIPTDNVQFFNA